MFRSIIKFVFVTSLLTLLGTDFISAQTVDQVNSSADEASGQYPPMNMGYAGFNSLGMTQSAWLDPMQNLGEGQSRPAYSKYYWSPDLVLPIRLREGMITMINFPEWEMIEDVFIGDNATFDGQIAGPNNVLLYPRQGANVGVDTNVIIFGRSGNRYVFYVKSEAINTERLTNSIIDIEVIAGRGTNSKAAGMSGGSSFGGSGRSYSPNNPNSSAIGKSADSTKTRRFQTEDWLREIPVDPAKFRFDIEVYVPNPDDVAIAPERVWRDDIFTYIDFGKRALNMNQRPIVTLIVERLEVPVGFRTAGPDNRLIIVEGIGDLVLRNGKRIVCLKLRRGDEAGLENAPEANDLGPQWQVGPRIPGSGMPQAQAPASEPYGIPRANINVGSNGSDGKMPAQYDIDVGKGEIIEPQYGNNQGGNINVSYETAGKMPQGMENVDYSKMQRITNPKRYGKGYKYLEKFSYGSGFSDGSSNISIELGTDANVANLETLWNSLSKKYSDSLGIYEPFFSVDAPADGQGKELFHLRVGPVNSLEEGDAVCGRLGRSGVFCSVVRTQ